MSAELVEAHEALADELSGLVRDIVMLHRPDAGGYCAGCNVPYATLAYGQMRPWRDCPTIRMVREGVGL